MLMKGQHIESVWTDENWPFTPEQDLAVFLEIARQGFLSDGTNLIPAFEALNYLAAYYWQREEAPETITIPFWAVEALAEGFLRYKKSHETGGTSLTLGEALHIERRGQGKRPRLHEAQKQLRDIRIATRLVLLEEQGWKIEAAIEEVAARSNMHHTTIRDLWSRHADHAREALEAFQQAQAPLAQTS
jgi:hypothetical protein